jgi:hypothetical protein
MKRTNLHAVQPAKRITRAMLKKAVALFRSPFAPRSVRRHNARQWILAMHQLGDKHVYRGGEAKWAYRSKS